MFLRPRRWGKSTFLQTLASYYDKRNKDHFDAMFSGLYIASHPTPARTSLLVLRFDFSSIACTTVEALEKQFCVNMNEALDKFLTDNYEFLQPISETILHPDNGRVSLSNVLVRFDFFMSISMVHALDLSSTETRRGPWA